MIGGYALLLVTAFKFLLYDYWFVFHLDIIGGFMIRGGYTYLITERYLTTMLLIVMISAVGLVTRKASSGVQLSERGDVSYLFLGLGIISFISSTVETSAFFNDYLLPARFAAISVLWTIFSVILMLLGFRKNNPVLRKVSFGLFLVVVLKVFLFDMSNFSTPYRIISFIFLGVILVGTSYLYYRKSSTPLQKLKRRRAGKDEITH